MCRNHRGFVDASVAAAKLGADILYLNTAFAGPQLVDVLEREQPARRDPRRGVHRAARRRPTSSTGVLAWTDDRRPRATTLEALIAAYPDRRPRRRPSGTRRIVILTSGTTGTPKGAPRKRGRHRRRGRRCSRGCRCGTAGARHIAAPLFHTWGFAHLALGDAARLDRGAAPQASTPRSACRSTQDERCDSLVVIPVMLQRILALPDETLDVLRPVAGARWSRRPARRCPATWRSTWMDRFGDNLYNIYGSTEVAYASIATPGRPARGAVARPASRRTRTVVKILDEDGDERRRRASPAGSSSATACSSRATPAAASKEIDRRADVDRRRRPVRRGRPAATSRAATTR